MKKFLWIFLIAALGGWSRADTTPAFNELTGTVASIDTENKQLDLAVDGGFNIQLTFDSKTSVSDGNQPIGISDLNYGDKIIARYAGRDLYAKQILRTPPPAPTAVAANLPAAVSSGSASAPTH